MKTWACAILFLGILSVSALAEEADKTVASEHEAAVTKIARDYEEAFNKADANAIGAMFAEDVEYTDEDGVLITGREALVEILKKGFALNPGAKMAIQIESVRSLAPDVAVERGTTLTTSADGEKVPSAYTAIHVRKDGKWHIQQMLDCPVPAPTPGEMLSELAWMVGTWKEKDGDADIETKVSWATGGNFLTRNFTVSIEDNVTLQGWQIVGWDAEDNNIRSWFFDSEGAFQEGVWTRTGNVWTIRQTGVLPDGGTLASESTLERVNNDQCTWEITNRTLDGDPQPNLPRIEMTRVKE